MKEYYSIGSIEDLVISNSSLSAINPEEGGSPRKFVEFFEKEEEESTRYFNLGTLLHDYVENPENFSLISVDKPGDALGEAADLVLKYCKDLRTEPTDSIVLSMCRQIRWNDRYGDAAIIKNASPKIIPYVEEALHAYNENKKSIDSTTREKLNNCIESLNGNPVARQLLYPSFDNENQEHLVDHAIYWTLVNDNLKCKALLDKVIIDHAKKEVKIIDLKTTGNGSVYQFAPYGGIPAEGKTPFERYRYYRQLAWYTTAIAQYLISEGYKEEEYTLKCYLVVVETTKLYQTAVYEIDTGKWIFHKGYTEIRNLLKRIIKHRDLNNWSDSLEELENFKIIKVT